VSTDCHGKGEEVREKGKLQNALYHHLQCLLSQASASEGPVASGQELGAHTAICVRDRFFAKFEDGALLIESLEDPAISLDFLELREGTT
jgi:hypothetical protein